MSAENIKAVFGIDMETDVGSFTPFYEGIKRGTPILLDMFENEGIKATFFFTGEAARENPDIARMVAESGNEVGCHSLYHETLGDELFPIPGLKPALPEEVPIRIKTATKWVEEASGIKPVSFRCPRLWGSTQVVNTLEELGYITDASYPMYFYRKQFAPYHPSKENWLEKGEMKILEIPVFADMLMESKDQPLERDRDQWPLFRTQGADALIKHIENFLLFLEQKGIPPVLCFYFHPWEFIPMERSFHFGECTVIPDAFITEGCGEKACNELKALIKYLKGMGAEFYRADELVKFNF
ncbi:MAG TPA: polysaccharide deacetylase family protein [Clostridiaceae bacterium]|nr:polysaccharide deacetylase family protein [Clostridiaceae bacterium]